MGDPEPGITRGHDGAVFPSTNRLAARGGREAERLRGDRLRDARVGCVRRVLRGSGRSGDEGAGEGQRDGSGEQGVNATGRKIDGEGYGAIVLRSFVR